MNRDREAAQLIASHMQGRIYHDGIRWWLRDPRNNTWTCRRGTIAHICDLIYTDVAPQLPEPHRSRLRNTDYYAGHCLRLLVFAPGERPADLPQHPTRPGYH